MLINEIPHDFDTLHSAFLFLYSDYKVKQFCLI